LHTAAIEIFEDSAQKKCYHIISFYVASLVTLIVLIGYFLKFPTILHPRNAPVSKYRMLKLTHTLVEKF
jgi:hypothetical protein